MNPVGHNNVDNIQNWTITSLLTSVTAIMTGWTINDWLSLGGFCLMAMTLFMNWLYRHREYKLKLEAHRARMRQCATCDPEQEAD